MKQKLVLSKKRTINIPTVDEVFISVLAGFIDGDGYINKRIRKSG